MSYDGQQFHTLSLLASTVLKDWKGYQSGFHECILDSRYRKRVQLPPVMKLLLEMLRTPMKSVVKYVCLVAGVLKKYDPMH